MTDENREVFIDATTLRTCAPEELKAVIKESQVKLLDLRTQAQFCSPGNSHLFKGYRKLIARAKTVLNER